MEPEYDSTWLQPMMMQPEYDSTSTTDTATSECRPVFWGGQLVYDVDVWGFNQDLKVVWDDYAATSILKTIANGTGLELLNNLVRISKDCHEYFIKNGVFELLVNEIMSSDSQNITGAVEALYYLVRDYKADKLPQCMLNQETNEKLVFIMLHCKLLDIQKRVIRMLMWLWKYFGKQNKISTEQYKIALLYVVWALDKYSEVVRLFVTNDENERIKMHKLCFMALKLVYQMMFTFSQYTNVKPIMIKLMGVGLLYSWTGVERVWFTIAACMEFGIRYLPRIQRYVVAYTLFNGFKSSDKQTHGVLLGIQVIMQN